MHPQEKQEFERLAQLRATIPPSFWEGGTLLYVGASPGRAECLNTLATAGYDITILEAYRPNADHYYDLGYDTICDTIQNAVIHLEPHDVVFWWHGPEHVEYDELPYILDDIEDIASKFVVLACPWGYYDQGAAYGNPYEEHLSHLYPEDFDGYNVSTLGEQDTRGSNLIAWKET